MNLVKRRAEEWRDKFSNPADFEEFGQAEAFAAGAKAGAEEMQDRALKAIGAIGHRPHGGISDEDDADQSTLAMAAGVVRKLPLTPERNSVTR